MLIEDGVAECEHPAYERAIRQFMDTIDAELSAVQEWNRNLPAAFQDYASEYSLTYMERWLRYRKAAAVSLRETL